MTYTKNDGPNGFFFCISGFFQRADVFFWGGVSIREISVEVYYEWVYDGS